MVVTAASGLRIGARFVVVAGGIGTFSPRRLPSLRAFAGQDGGAQRGCGAGPVGQPVPWALHRCRGRPALKRDA
jgi:hypothetical protein